MSAFTEGRWLTPAETARRLNVTPQWVVRLADSGQIRSERTPLGRLLDIDSVEEFAERRQRQRARAVEESTDAVTAR